MIINFNIFILIYGFWWIFITFFRGIKTFPKTYISPPRTLASPPKTSPQPLPVSVEELKEDKSPVICRVSKNSGKDTYQMYVSFNFIFLLLL